MYRKIRTKGIASFDVETDPLDSLYEIKSMLGFGKEYDDIGIYQGAIKSWYDESYHGSSSYKYSLISDKQEDIDAFKAINLLIEYIKKQH